MIAESGFWQERIRTLTLAAIKFEMLSRQPLQVMTLTQDCSEAKVGSFVLYNYSRLATLFSHFYLKVDEGK